MIDEKTIAQRRTVGSKEKLTALWRDKRSYRSRLLLAFCATLALFFTTLFFGPVEITASSADSLDFTVSQITPIMGILAAVAICISAPLLALLRGRIYNYAVTAVFSLTLCAYIQGNILSGAMGALTGDSITWYAEKFQMLLNFLTWIILFLIPYIVLYFSKKIWKNALMFVSLALVVMQLVALVTIVMGGAYSVAKQKGNSLTTDSMFSYSEKSNTLVFLLDRLDYQYIEGVMESDPAFFDKLDGFTSYTNAISPFPRTKPAANFMLSGCENLLYTLDSTAYFENAWDSNPNANILKDLSANDYRVDIYANIGETLGRGESTGEYVDNLSSNLDTEGQKISIAYKNVIKGLSFLSCYRYLPTAMRPFFWCSTDDVNRDVFVNSNTYHIDETAYDRGLSDMALVAENNFKFYHFNGPHAPYHMDEDGTVNNDKETDVITQTKGSFNILYRAFNKMKELGIYKDASIIITADHGFSESDYEPLSDAVTIGLFYKPAGAEGTALQQSKAPVSLKNIPATIAKSAGIPYAAYGKPLDEVAETENVTRTFYKAVMGDYREETLYTYEINGDANDFENWKEISSEPIQYPFY